jgi:Na+/H+-dicarboxylate symporter
MLMELASYISEAFMNLLKLVSVPVLFLSIVTVASGMENMNTMAKMGKKVIKYTLITTVAAATFALMFFLLFDPVRGAMVAGAHAVDAPTAEPGSYWRHLLSVVPSNIVQPFATNNVIGVLVVALFMGLGMFAIPVTQRETLHNLFSALYSLFMKITGFIVRLIPIALWAFIALFMRDVQAGLELKTVGLYLATVLCANLFQGFVVLPVLLKIKGVPVRKLAQAMFPALTVAFFTKSSTATVPSAVRCAQERAGIQQKVASFAFPLCTSINMNGCAAFILTTVLFVSMLHGMTFGPLELVLWIFMATLAAVGNASVPMGCFFLAGAFLAAMNVPLNLMGVILPFYAFLDAIETAINVWSDSCVVAVVDKELQEEEKSVSISI